MALFVHYFIACTQLYMFRVKHVELFAGNKILYKKCHLFGTFLKIKKKIMLFK
jgi:hypothetical protein